MSTPQPTPEAPGQVSPLVAKIVLVALAIPHLPWALSIQAGADAAASRLAAEQGAPFWWAEPNPAAVIAMVAAFGLAALAWRYLRIGMRRVTLVILGGALTAVLTACNLFALYGAANAGYAGPAGATWLRGAQVIETRAWGEATMLAIGCKGRRAHRSTLRYDVVFAGRQAPLGHMVDDPVPPAWLNEIAHLEAALRPSIPVTRLDLDAYCVEAMARGLDAAAATALVGLLHPNAEDVQRLAAAYPQLAAPAESARRQREAAAASGLGPRLANAANP